ncbi:Sec23-binding domain of Sec16-domain-containing protein [Lobosporangium transversale]|uniref:Protein transport protein sec16 n=1 Tax=Lobosporangium transversale TaxID=64571 RepID=A0A1Y2GH84_9FUNG|nr:Sec23-binding domain of Sec16-domain-containing protein [Lobosporangium transversale]ORZ09434.1 Sec23-binding domain of Sec16-domain-containing protein [Lobosporangium transversale]|eukprot:XP_021878887.1 Sec23-binding domain of Sec16-domain-containing protein [Lobosporangium transversale]
MVSFPRLVQRFDSASNTMITKKYPGDLQLKHVKEVLSVDKDIATYPGPLLVDNAAQMKNKRKDVLKFIEHKINGLEHGQQDDAFDAHRVLIWRLFKVMFEQEGALVGGPKIDEAVRSVLLSIPLTMYPAESFHEHTGPVRTSASLDKLQDLLRRGDRAGAVRYAMNANLWAHALVISSSVNKELWKEAVNGFVNQELMAGGGEQQANGREAMRVLYALFSGQTQSAINEIIPMGLRNPPEDTQNGSQVQEEQFVTAESLSFVKPIEEPKIPGTSLGQWRDTLAMILSNRTAGDQSAICSLGDLLMKEGWVEAAHICYLLSPQVSLHSGLDAPSNRLVLIGADQSPYAAFPFYKNITAFQKTEIYEFACALKSPGVASALPFLQPYKLHYVWTLVELGMFSEAGRYLESIEAIVKSQTKGSPYYNVVFLERLKDITERLTGSSQLTVTEESWFTKKVPKPTIGGIFDALDSKISKFIAGDNDQPKPVIVEPKANSVESGPFANAPALPDLSNIPPRALSRSSNGARATNQDSAIDRSRRPSGSKLEVPKANIYGQGQPTTTYANPIQASGYDQNDEYGLQTYPQTDANTAYGYHSQGYNNDPNQTFEESYQEGGETSDYRGYSQQAQPQEQQMFTNSGGQLAQSGYDTNYNTGYNSQYDNQYAGQGDFTNESVATQAAQTDATFLNPGSAHYSATAALDSVKPAEDGYQTGADTILATTCEYGVAHEIQAEGPSYNYTGEGVYNGEYQQGQEYQGNQEQQYDGSPGEQQHDQTYAEQQYDQAYGQQHDQAYDEQQYDQNYNGQQQYDQSGYQDQSQFQTIEGVNQDFAAEYKDYSYQEQDADQKQQVSLAATPAAEASGNAIRSYERTEILADEPTLEQQVYSSETIPTAVANDSAPVIGSQQGSYGYHEGDFQQAEYQQGDYQQGEYQDQSEYQQGYRQGDHQLQDDYQQGNYHQDDYQQGDYQQGDYQQGDYQQGDYQQGDYQQEGYQQEGYQQEGYQQEGYQQEGYQQGDYQQGDYQQGSYQQGGYQQDNNSKNAPPLDETAQPGFSGSNAPSMSEDHKDQVVGQGDQAQQSHFNDNAWWSNGGNGSVDPNGTEEQQVFAANDNSQEPVQESYEEGQFISFGAVPTIPSFGQPAMPVNNSNQHTFDDDDDLGMGNNALNKGKTAATEKTDGTTATQASEDSSTPDNGSNEPKAGWWPKLSLLVGEKRESTPRPVRANLGEESSFYFDKEQQRWVNKKGGAESSSTAEPLPPPAMPRTSSPASGPPNSATGSSAARRGARSKYVDVLNTN